MEEEEEDGVTQIRNEVDVVVIVVDACVFR
jgi:hypothetical protein